MNKCLAVIFILTSLIISLTFTVEPIKASPHTITVPDNYPTITDAIANATNGDTIFVRKGTYQEHSLTINKTLTLIGQDANTTIIKNIDPLFISTDLPPIVSVTIRVAANNVTVSGFTLTDGGNGLTGGGIGTLIIGNIIIAPYGCISLSGANQTIAQNTVENPYEATGTYTSGYGIHCSGSYNNIISNSITGANHNGITLLGGSTFNVVYDNILTDATDGIGVNGDGNVIAKNDITVIGGAIYIDGGSNNTICANSISDGGGIAVTKGYNNIIRANYIANNRVGATIGNAQSEVDYMNHGPVTANNKVYHNNFVNNVFQVKTDFPPGYTVYSTDFWDNGTEGNFWSDYTGIDNNGDGIGDTPYEIDVSRSDHYPLMSPFDISSVNVELPEWTNITSSTPPFPTPTSASSPSASTPKTPNPTTPTPQPQTPTPTHPPSTPPSTTQQPTPSNSASPTGNNAILRADTYWTAATIVTVIIAVIAVAFMLKKQHASR